MKKLTKQKGCAVTLPEGMLSAALAQVVLTIFLAAIMSLLLDKQKISMEQTGYFVMGSLFLTAFISAVISIRKVKHRSMLVCMLTAAMYLGILFSIAILMFDGKLEAIGETMLPVLAGSVLPGLLAAFPKQPYKKLKYSF